MNADLRAEVEQIVAHALASGQITGPNREANMREEISREDREAIGRTAYFAIKAAMEDDVARLGEILGESTYPAGLLAIELALMCAHTIRQSSTRARRLADLRRLVGLSADTH